MIKNFVFVLFVFVEMLLIPLSAIASLHSSYYFKSLEVEDGLSQTMVYAILQDKQGFMWFGTQNGLNRYDGKSFKVYKRDAFNENGIQSNAIFSLAEDENGILWIGTDEGVQLYDHNTESFSMLSLVSPQGDIVEGVVRSMLSDSDGNMWIGVSGWGVVRVSSQKEMSFYSLKEYLQKGNGIQSLCLDKDGNLWIATHQQGVLKLDTNTGRVSFVSIELDQVDLAANEVNCVCLLDSETMLVGTVGHGVLKLDLRTETFSSINGNYPESDALFVRCIFKDESGKLWFGTQSGLYVYSIESGYMSHFQHVFNDPYSLSDNAVHSIYQDREGGMWFGTYFGGVNYYSASFAGFEKFYPVPGEDTLRGKCISEFCEDAKGNIWVGTEDGGLNCYDFQTNQFKHGFVSAMNIHALMCDANSLWIGSFAEGLFILDLSTGAVKNFRASVGEGKLSDDNIYAIYKDFSGVVWIGSMSGLQCFDSVTGKFCTVNDSVITSHVNDIIEDFNGVLWFATLGQGLFSYDRKNDKWEHYPTVSELDDVRGKMVVCLHEDKNHKLWIGTSGAGLVCRDRQTNSFSKPLGVADGLPDNVVYVVLEDNDGAIWGSTNNGLFKLNPETQMVKTYTHANGLLGDQFNYKSGLVSRNGKIYFGGVKGFVAFESADLVSVSPPPALVFNSFQIDNEEVGPSINNSLLEKSITDTQEISVPYNRSAFTIGFVALSYASQHRIRYAFKLDGWDSDWVDAGSINSATYSNLDPGKYTFYVKVIDSDGVWNDIESSIRINILPPFYMTIWAYVVYLVVFLLTGYLLFKGYMNRLKKRSEEAMKQLQHDKEKELYNAKINFFTNITHEIRTPLSLIKVPLEEVMKRIDKTDVCFDQLSIIQRNTNRLLKLVNELLDFRKVETRGIELNFVRLNVVELLHETVKRFEPTAELQNLELNVEVLKDRFFADLDAEIVVKILSNLLSNALKHAKSYIRITLAQGDDMLRITVSNDGDCIPSDQIEHIFLPFVKLNHHSLGSGIGLSLSRTLAEAHGGKIFVDTSACDTSFVLMLPICQKRVMDFADEREVNSKTLIDECAENAATRNVVSSAESSRLTLLLVEDNMDFRNLLANQLADEYHVVQADNGAKAVNLLEHKMFDLIISDIMMPVMDGLALCRHVKSTLRYSHIPVILLTAKTGLQSQLDGLKVGADEYVVKPHSIDYLKARIANLLDNRQKIRNAYKCSPESTIDVIVNSRADEDFLNRLVDIIHKNLDASDLDVDFLALHMNMSRATLYRKVKSISELTPNDFIRLIRLKKAAELLKKKEYRVNEIAFIVGFNSSSYFSKCFFKQFGVLPKDFARGNDE